MATLLLACLIVAFLATGLMFPDLRITMFLDLSSFFGMLQKKIGGIRPKSFEACTFKY